MDAVYKIIFLAGTSMEGYEQAVMNAINRASKTLNDVGMEFTVGIFPHTEEEMDLMGSSEKNMLLKRARS
jgi:flavin-binding protein dodecin